MKLITLAKKEAQDILRNKIYLLVVFVQVFIIFGAFGLAVASSIAMDPNLLDSYGLSSSLKVGISQDLNGSALAKDLEAQNLNLIYFKDMNQANNLLGTRLVAVVEVSSQPKQDVTVHMDTANVFYPVVSTKVNSAVNKFKVEKRLESAGVNDSDIQKVQNLVTLNVVGVKKNQDAGIALDSPYFVEIMYGFIVPFILLLPIFLAGNIVTDSIVGERERKTFEILLMAPISSSMVILGKTLPILIFSLVQSVAWMLILEILHVPIYNSFSLIFILFFVGLGFIGAGIFISMLVDSTKEANSAITMLLVFATFLLFMPLFITSSYFEGILNFIPTVLMVKLASTPNINPEIMLLSLPTVFLSSFIFLITVRYFKHERAIRL
ncbi:ABC transporter permease [Methanobacterium paludis]|uniref:ABC-2 type transporter n=1 Tax=Methanobacterium paludis (strain DSM 25820 / JCM 18151 / SWAN1) TaxID=868131 RepID=F6D5W9_METPW|nr:ABC transporter permease [Methanobacterium paludis]AEG19339.1 ABC-2 type transporter [Methanobacterium paludis]